MARLQKWRPFRDLESLRDDFDRLMDRFGEDWFSGRELFQIRPAIEAFFEDGKFTVRTEMPGVDPKDVEIHLTGQTLTIRGKREQKLEEKKRHFLRRELRYGSFERSMEVPEGIKAEDLKAVYRDGVLELTAPAPKELAPKEVKIEIEHEAPKKIESKEHEAA